MKEPLLDYKKRIVKNLDSFLYKRNKVQVFTDAVEYNALKLAIVVSPQKQEERIKRIKEIFDTYYADEKDKQAFDSICLDMTDMLSKMIDHYCDHLGEIYMELSGGKKAAGQYFTPYDVSRLMAEMTVGQSDISGGKILTFNEPCCGSGGIIVAVADALNSRGFNYTNDAVFVANDIDRNCALMCYLQTSWAAMPAIVLHQDTITQKAWDEFITPAFALQYPKFVKALSANSNIM